MKLSVALLHHPVLDTRGEVVTTAITNLDVHDIARSSRTYELERYFVVTPVRAMRDLLDGMLAHWLEGAGKTRVPARAEAFRRVCPATDLNEVITSMTAADGIAPRVVATAARPPEGWEIVSFEEERLRLQQSDAPTLLLLGTGHGLAPSVMEQADVVLEPIRAGGYNHLSVRSAAAILFDRLVGERSGR